MSDLLFAVGVLIHTFGLIIWAGGEIWIAVFVAKAQKSKSPHGMPFILEMIHTISKVMTIGLVLVIVGGATRIVGANAVGVWTDPGNLWGAMMLTKHALIVVLVINSILIVKKVTPAIVANMPAPNSPPSEAFLRATGKLEKFSQTNLFITLVIIVISVMAVTV